MPRADLAAQRALLQLADTDRLADAAAHQRGALPEIGVIAAAAARAEALTGRVALAEVEIGDMDSAARKLDDEIESVRARAARDEQRLASGAASPKEMENLQHEVESLARRQSTLEDDALELMEQRETAGAKLDAARAELAAARAEADAATVRRNDLWADIDAEIARFAVQRAALVSQIPAEVVAVYDKVRAAGKVAAAALVGDRCAACQMGLDRVSLDEIHAAGADEVPRCPECGALLVRG